MIFGFGLSRRQSASDWLKMLEWLAVTRTTGGLRACGLAGARVLEQSPPTVAGEV
jgi:hypothetical protein